MLAPVVAHESVRLSCSQRLPASSSQLGSGSLSYLLGSEEEGDDGRPLRNVVQVRFGWATWRVLEDASGSSDSLISGEEGATDEVAEETARDVTTACGSEAHISLSLSGTASSKAGSPLDAGEPLSPRRSSSCEHCCVPAEMGLKDRSGAAAAVPGSLLSDDPLSTVLLRLGAPPSGVAFAGAQETSAVLKTSTSAVPTTTSSAVNARTKPSSSKRRRSAFGSIGWHSGSV